MDIKSINKMPRRLYTVIFLFLLISGNTLSAQEMVLKTVQADEYFTALEQQEKATGKAVLLDVRTPGEYNRGHAPTSENTE